MKIKYFLFCFVFVFFAGQIIHAQNVQIRYYKISEIKKCENCGRWKEDIWEGKFRIENISNIDLVIYGMRFEKEFNPSVLIQRRNPDDCEWKYGNGRSDYGASWEERSSSDKDEEILKAKQFIDIDFSLNNFDFNKAIRFTAYVAEKSGEIPDEVFSEPFILQSQEFIDEKGELQKSENPKFVSINSDCEPSCKLSIEQAPSINGIKLGMTFDEVREKFPKARFSDWKEGKYQIKAVYIWNWKEDLFDLKVTFLEDKVVKIEAQYKSIQEYKGNNPYLIVAEKFGLEKLWNPQSRSFKCKEFEIELNIDSRSKLIIRNKAAEELFQQFIIDSYKKK